MAMATPLRGASRPTVARGARSRANRLAVRANAGSHYGVLFRVSTFGESHGKGVGCIVDGVPPRLQISEEEIQAELDRRKVRAQHGAARNPAFI